MERLTHHKRQPLLLAIAASIALLGVPSQAAATGGISAAGTDQPTGTKAKLVKGKAIPPRNAPEKIKRIIKRANEIRNKPYRWGGGHASWNDKGYDCSGAISYALRGAGKKVLSSPLNSTGFMRWGRKGKGKWVTVYANHGHAYAVIAGLRWDTSMTPGNGPGWSKQMRSGRGYKKRTHSRL